MPKLNTFRIIFIIFIVISALYIFYPSSSTRRKIPRRHGVPEIRASTYNPLDIDTPEYIKEQLKIGKAIEIAQEKLQELASSIKTLPIEGIPGTKISDSETAAKIQRSLDCLTMQGSWVYNSSKIRKNTLNHKYESFHGVCDKKFYKYQQNVHNNEEDIREAIKYEWIPSQLCGNNIVQDFIPSSLPSREDFCRLFKHGIVIVGDTLSYQLHDILLDFFHDSAQTCYGETYCVKHPICTIKENKWVIYRRSDYLIAQIKDEIKPGTPGHPPVKVINKAYLSAISGAGVVILNRGTQYVDDETFATQLIQNLVFIRNRYPDAFIIYRGTYRGHIGCDDDWSKPNGQILPLNSPRRLYELENLPYNWGDFHRQNLMAKEIIRSLGGLYWDTEVQLEYRQDGHIGNRNCLKYCIPGPLDNWINTLYWILKTVKDPSKVAK